MWADAEKICLWRKIGSEQQAVKLTRMTQLGHRAGSAGPVIAILYAPRSRNLIRSNIAQAFRGVCAMRRREFTAGVLLAAVPWSVRAQQRATQHRIAIFHPAIPTTFLTEAGGGSAWRAFFSELRRLGYVEGENLIIERYSAEGHHERFADLARDIVSSSPALIVTGTNPVVIAFKAVTSTLPIVAFMLDPLKAGLVANLAKPGGNLTGITLDAGIEIWESAWRF
jgi:hypothetical protein